MTKSIKLKTFEILKIPQPDGSFRLVVEVDIDSDEMPFIEACFAGEMVRFESELIDFDGFVDSVKRGIADSEDTDELKAKALLSINGKIKAGDKVDLSSGRESAINKAADNGIVPEGGRYKLISKADFYEASSDPRLMQMPKVAKFHNSDVELLNFIHERMILVYGENQNVDYMIKLRAIIAKAEVHL